MQVGQEAGPPLRVPSRDSPKVHPGLEAKAYPASTQKAAASVLMWDKVVFQPKHVQ